MGLQSKQVKTSWLASSYQEKIFFQLNLKFHELDSKDVCGKKNVSKKLMGSAKILLTSLLPCEVQFTSVLLLKTGHQSSRTSMSMEEDSEEFLPKLVVFDLGECVTGQCVDEFSLKILSGAQ